MAANATAVWRVRPSGNNNNGGGYDAGIASAGTDYSQQNAAQVTQSGGTVSTATVTLTDTGASFTSALIGNGIRVAGTGITTTYTFITAVPTSTTLTLQTSPGTTGTSVTYSIGGGWADFWTNPNVGSAPVVAGNTVFILGSGTPNPSSYTYDYTLSGQVSFLSGSSSNGNILFANDPSTPGYKSAPDTTGGMPCVSFAGASNGPSYLSWLGIYFVGNSGSTSNSGIFNPTGFYFLGCVFDQLAHNAALSYSANQSTYISCEVFTSTAPGGPGGNPAIYADSGSLIQFCNIHDAVGVGVWLNQGSVLLSSIIAKCLGTGIVTLNSAGANSWISNCTIDGNGGNGIEFFRVATNVVVNNIISNHVSGDGMIADSGSAAVNSTIIFADANTFYNNTANYSSINAGPHDTVLGVTPYVASSTENYTLV